MFLIIVISIIGAVYLWKRYASIITRDNMNYQEYDWYFDPNASSGSATTTSDPWLSTSFGTLGTCIGQACCSTGLVYDSSSNQCVDVTSTSTNANTTSVQESFETINKVLTKQQPGMQKMQK